MTSRKVALALVALMALSAFALGLSGCGPGTLKIGTTTALQKSGLLTKINEDFKKQYGYDIAVTAKATSAQVLKLGEEGEVDLLLVNSRDGVKALVQKGLAVEDKDIMYADLVVVGPKSDPAQIRGLDCPGKSSTKIAKAGATYIAKGDGSDLDNKIMGYWKKIKIDPAGQSWFIVTKQPTAESLKVASDKQGYMIVDRQSWLENKNGLNLEVLVQGCSMLYDQYTAVVVNPVKHPDEDINVKGAEQYIAYLATPEVQKEIAAHKKLGTALFIANAPKAGQPATQSTTQTSAPSSAPSSMPSTSPSTTPSTSPSTMPGM